MRDRLAKESWVRPRYREVGGIRRTGGWRFGKGRPSARIMMSGLKKARLHAAPVRARVSESGTAGRLLLSCMLLSCMPRLAPRTWSTGSGPYGSTPIIILSLGLVCAAEDARGAAARFVSPAPAPLACSAGARLLPPYLAAGPLHLISSCRPSPSATAASSTASRPLSAPPCSLHPRARPEPGARARPDALPHARHF